MTTEPIERDLEVPTLGEDLFDRPDRVLQDMDEFSSIMGISVTLYLPHGTASGAVAPASQFFDWVARSTRESAAGDEYEKAVDTYARIFDRWGDLSTKPKDDDPRDLYTSRFIHLKDAECSRPGADDATRHEFLRVKLSSVSAWSAHAVRARAWE